MKRFGFALGILAGAVLVPAHAQKVVEGVQPPARTLYIYNAGSVATAKLAEWGNGEAGPSRDYRYNGDGVVKIRTRNYYEGARFDLNEPIDIAPYKKDGFLRFRMRFPLDRTMNTGRDGGRGGQPGGAPGALPPGFGPAPGDGGTARGGFPRMNELVTTQRNAQFGGLPVPNAPRPGGPGMPGLGGEIAEPVGPPPQKTSLTRLRVEMLHEQGVTAGTTTVDLNALTPDDDGWRTLFMPLRGMRSTADVQGPVRRIVLTADKDDSFWLAQFALVIETGQMRVSIRRPTDPVGAQIADITVKPGPLPLIADVESGIADPIIEWNFDADNVGNLPPAQFSQPPVAGPDDVAAPGPAPAVPGAAGEEGAAPIVGPRIDAIGLRARFTYPNEEQNYRVEVTVRDRSGQKTPVRASILVRVRG